MNTTVIKATMKPGVAGRFLLAGTLLLSSLAHLPASGVREIQDNPEKYVGKEVIVRASVEGSLNVPFTDYALFVLEDGERKMPLFAPRRDVEKGKTIRVRVKVLGIKQSSVEETGKRSAEGLSDFLIEREIAEPGTAQKIGRGIMQLLEGLGSVGAGSYLLITDSW